MGSLLLDVDPDTGEFTSPAVAPGERDLGWIFPPFGDLLPNTRAATVDIVAGRTTNAGIIPANPATHGTIRGKVTDHTGQPIAGVTVTGSGPDPWEENPLWTTLDTPWDYGTFDFRVTTDADTDEDAGASVADRCSAVHNFGAQPVDVAKTADGQTVLAQLRWRYHDSIGCFLVLDSAATAALRAARS